MAELSKLSVKIKALPDTPGVYEFFDSKGRIIYVGKALRLKRRVSSYFKKGRPGDGRIEMLRNEISDLKIIKTSSEAEALIYEAGLIKDHSPKYNIDLKDDKSFPYLKLTINEKYPRLFLTRRRLSDGAVYYGPYVNVTILKEAISFMKRVFPLRTCRKLRKSLCLEYHIGQCAGPCSGKITVSDYQEMVLQLKQFLEGKKDDLIIRLEGQMKKFSGNKDFEKALFVKQRIEALTAMQQSHDRSLRPIFGELDELRNVLRLESIPVSIECFDISNISGTLAVGSMVRFVAGRAKKSDYRRFRIKNVGGVDDYSMIREVVRRRYVRLIEEGKSLPDLVLIDGGKGHLAAAKQVFDELNIKKTALASIAKEHNHLYCFAHKGPIRLSPGSRLLLLIQRIRDEAHRFAVTYHRSLRRRDKFETTLKEIPGIGPLREKLLIDRFGKVEKIRQATTEGLKEAGIDNRTAGNIMKYFRKNK